MSANSLRGTPEQNVEFKHLHFFYGESYKAIMYSSPIENKETLRDHSLDDSHTISSFSGTFERVRQSVIRDVRACIDAGGRHFEHFCEFWLDKP
jgi:hypothetical protein